MNKPDKIDIFGTVYSVSYHDRPIDVDKHGRVNHAGQIDYWDKTIRIYNCSNNTDVWKSILHEVIHGIAEEYNIDVLDKDENHDSVDLLSKALIDTFVRNGWIEIL